MKHLYLVATGHDQDGFALWRRIKPLSVLNLQQNECSCTILVLVIIITVHAEAHSRDRKGHKSRCHASRKLRSLVVSPLEAQECKTTAFASPLCFGLMPRGKRDHVQNLYTGTVTALTPRLHTAYVYSVCVRSTVPSVHSSCVSGLEKTRLCSSSRPIEYKKSCSAHPATDRLL